MKNYISKIWKLTLSSVLALTGFSACSADSEEDEPILLMYGPPQAGLYIDGNVSNQQGAAIENARIIAKGIYDGDISQETIDEFYSDTTYTDKEGKYEIRSPQKNTIVGYKLICDDPKGDYEPDSVVYRKGDKKPDWNFILKKK